MPRSARLAVALTLCAFLLDAPATAAPSTTPEQSFVTNGAVHSVLRTPDRTYIGGDFTYVGPRTGFGAVLAFNGAFDPSYPEVNGRVNTSVQDGAGGYFIGGDFTRVGNFDREGLAHILQNGTVDPNFAPDFTFINSGGIKSLSRLGGLLYVAGSFSHVGGVARANVARVSPTTGALETEWAPTVGGVETILATSNRVYFGGTFTTVNNVARKRLGAVHPTTGALDTGFIADLDSDESTKNAKALHVKNGRLYVAGAFGTVNGTARAGVAAVNPTTGVLDTGFAPTGLFDFQSYTSLASDNTQLFVGGDRNQVQSMDLVTGARDSDFEAFLEGSFNAEANTLAVSGSTLLVGGFFTRVNGTPRQRFAALETATGAVSSSTVQSFSHPPRTITPPDSFTGGKTFVGGEFTSAGGVERRSVAALDAAGDIDPAFAQNGLTDGFSGGDPAQIDALAVRGGRLYVGGDIREVDGEDKFGVFALDTATGDIDESFNGETSGAGGGEINDLEMRDGRLYVAGQFHDIGGSPRRNLAALDPGTGTPVAGFAPDPRHVPSDFDDVAAMAFHGRRMYVAGRFTTIGGVARNSIAALDASTGAVDPAFEVEFETNQSQPMRSLAADGSRVYVGGLFTAVNGFPRSNVAAVTASGGDVVVGWGPTLTSSPDEIVLAGDRVFMAGFFNSVNGVTRRGFAAVARSNGALDPWDLAAGGAGNGSAGDPGIGHTIAVAHGRVDAGGLFTRIQGRARSGLVSVATPMPVSAAPPTVSGTRRAGEVLTCSPGTWSNNPSFGFEWLRDGARIDGATAATYTVAEGDAGTRIACLVTASNADGSAERASADVTIERPPAQPSTPPPTAGGTQPGGSPPPTGDPGPPRQQPAVARIARTAAKVRKGVVTVKLTCPSGGGGCSGTLVLSTTERRAKRLGSARFRIAAGRSASVNVKVARKLRAKVAKLKKVRATAGGAQATLKVRKAG